MPQDPPDAPRAASVLVDTPPYCSTLVTRSYSHPINYKVPAGVTVDVDKQGKITVKGIDKEVVGQTAAVIRGFRPPDAYKGKGVRYEGEYIRLKAGKAAKA